MMELVTGRHRWRSLRPERDPPDTVVLLRVDAFPDGVAFDRNLDVLCGGGADHRRGISPLLVERLSRSADPYCGLPNMGMLPIGVVHWHLTKPTEPTNRAQRDDDRRTRCRPVDSRNIDTFRATSVGRTRQT